MVLQAFCLPKMAQEREIIVGENMEIIILDEIVVMPVLGLKNNESK